MNITKNGKQLGLLLAGDLAAIGIVTLAGFATHGTAGTAGARMLTTFIPLTLAWFLTAPFLGAYNLPWTASYRQLWRPFWAMVLAGPLAAVLRGFMLGNAPILPIFVVVLGGVGALGMLAWRALYALVVSRME